MALKQLNLRARHNEHVIAIEEVITDNIVLVPPANFVIKDSDILIMLSKSKDVKQIKDLNAD